MQQPEDSFQYLGSMVRIDGDSTPETQCARLAMARDATSQLIGLCKAKEFSLKWTKYLGESLVLSVAFMVQKVGP